MIGQWSGVITHPCRNVVGGLGNRIFFYVQLELSIRYLTPRTIRPAIKIGTPKRSLRPQPVAAYDNGA